MMTRAKQLASELANWRQLSADQCVQNQQQRQHWESFITAEWVEILKGMSSVSPPSSKSTAERWWSSVLETLATQSQVDAGKPGERCSQELHEVILVLYNQLGQESPIRHHLLTVLSSSTAKSELSSFVNLITKDPPNDSAAAAIPFFPLWAHKRLDPNRFFPSLLDGLAHLQVAAPIVDLANYMTRRGWATQHPAVSRSHQLENLLAGVTQNLQSLEKPSPQSENQLEKTHKMIQDGIALAISVCDALAWIGDSAALAKLYPVLQLGHRRLRVEAAAAIFRLGDQQGSELLADLAAEASVRPRVLAYAQELDILSQVKLEHQSPQARAEGELFAYLAQPTHLGFPPTSCELIDTRTQFWPGFEEPITCYLFQFTYQFQKMEYRNIGISGPLSHSFKADLTNLRIPEIYAIFAGWQAEHEEIQELDAGQCSTAQRAALRPYLQMLEDEGYVDIEIVQLGLFFSEQLLIATARQQQEHGVAIVGQTGIQWYPTENSPRSLGAEEVYMIHKGRRLLDSFN